MIPTPGCEKDATGSHFNPVNVVFPLQCHLDKEVIQCHEAKAS